MLHFLSIPFLYSELEETINAMKQVAVDKVELTRASQDFQLDLDVSLSIHLMSLEDLVFVEIWRVNVLTLYWACAQLHCRSE